MTVFSKFTFRFFSISKGTRTSTLINRLGQIFVTCVVLGLANAVAQPAGWREQANQAMRQGDYKTAIAVIDAEVKLHPSNVSAHTLAGQMYAHNRSYAKAVEAFSEALKLSPSSVSLFQARGDEYLKLGKFEESIRDFDKVIELQPRHGPHHWQRGIALYYAGRYEDGKTQFESHQTVNSSDVENAVWHFICTARARGLDNAKKLLIPISGDPRVPMTQIHSLFDGKLTTEGVMKAAKEASSPDAETSSALFYAHLYLGIYFDITGESQKANHHTDLAAKYYDRYNYMGEVARIHKTHLTRSKANKP
jgi:lipoprotein NlpI